MNDEIPEAEIREAINNNAVIHFLGFSHSHWVLVTEQKPRQQKFVQHLTIIPDGADMVLEIEKVWKANLVVLHLATGNGHWILITGEKTDIHLHWTQEVVLLNRQNWNKQLLDNTGLKDPTKIKNLFIFEMSESYGILINWVLQLPKNVVWDVPTIFLSQTIPLSKWNELGGRMYQNGQFFLQK